MKKIIFLVLFLGIGPFMVWENSNILSEYKFQNENLTVAPIPTADRKCSSTVFVFHQCSFNYILGAEKIYKNYRFFAFGSPNTVQMLISDKSQTITSTVAHSYFWNRIFTVIFSVLISLLTLIAILPSNRKASTRASSNLQTKIKMDNQPNQSSVQGNAPVFGKR